MTINIKTQSELASVKQFNCTGCGSALEVMHPRAQYVTCQYCGSVLDNTSEEHQILEELGKPTRHKPMSFIQIGQLANFNGIDYQVIARTRWRQKYKEYWVEEGESGYSNEVWVYDEWLMISPDRTYFYLIEDREGYWVSNEIIPETPMLLPSNLRMSFYQQQPNHIVREYGGAEVIYFEGESNYRIKRGDAIRFAMFSERGIHYSAEWRLADDGDEIKEVEFFKETPISRRKLLEAFSNNEEIEKLKETEANWRYVFRVAAATFFALILGLLYSWVSDGQVVFEQRFNPAEISDQSPLQTKAIDLEPGLYQLSLQAVKMVENSEMYLFAYILDQEEKAINTMDGEFYYYTGYDDEGKWTESSVQSGKIFRLQEPGTYHVQVLRDSAESIAGGEVSLTVRKDIPLTRYFVIGLVLLLIPMGLAWSRSGR
jgi:ribosomal protein S27E